MYGFMGGSHYRLLIPPSVIHLKRNVIVNGNKAAAGPPALRGLFRLGFSTIKTVDNAAVCPYRVCEDVLL